MGSCFGKKKVISKPGTKFSEIKNKVKPLDLIVFRGSEFVSDTISLMQKLVFGNGDWSHCGIVITSDIIPIKNAVPGKLYIWESTMSGKLLGDGVNNVETDKATFGVQIRDLESVINNYDNAPDTKIGWAPLINNPLLQLPGEKDDTYFERKDKVIKLISDFDTKIGNATYDYNIMNLISTLMPCCSSLSRNIFGNSDKYFCSELVANVYQMIGVIDKKIDPENVAPETLLGNNTIIITSSPVKCPPLVITREWNS